MWLQVVVRAFGLGGRPASFQATRLAAQTTPLRNCRRAPCYKHTTDSAHLMPTPPTLAASSRAPPRDHPSCCCRAWVSSAACCWSLRLDLRHALLLLPGLGEQPILVVVLADSSASTSAPTQADVLIESHRHLTPAGSTMISWGVPLLRALAACHEVRWLANLACHRSRRCTCADLARGLARICAALATMQGS